MQKFLITMIVVLAMLLCAMIGFYVNRNIDFEPEPTNPIDVGHPVLPTTDTSATEHTSQSSTVPEPTQISSDGHETTVPEHTVPATENSEATEHINGTQSDITVPIEQNTTRKDNTTEEGGGI